MEFSDTKLLALDIGPAGTVLPLNNFALEACFITKRHTLATGLKTSEDARNTVSYLTFVRGYATPKPSMAS